MKTSRSNAFYLEEIQKLDDFFQSSSESEKEPEIETQSIMVQNRMLELKIVKFKEENLFFIKN